MSDAIRQLGRTGAAVPRVVWWLPASGLPRACQAVLRGVGHKTVIVPVGFDESAAATVPPDFAVMIEVTAEQLRRERGAAVVRRLAALGRRRCLAVVLGGVDALELKAGWPTHRFQQLREQGASQALLIDCQDVATAAWAAAHSTAAGVVARFDPADQHLAHRALPEAAEAEAAVLASSVLGVARSLAFRVGDPRITAAVEELPNDARELCDLLAGAVRPWSVDERTAAWHAFAARHPAPAQSRGGHAPEE